MAVKMGVICSSAALVTTYKTKAHHNPEDKRQVEVKLK
jgi:hypothetical protein